jgi:hypothetical protein
MVTATKAQAPLLKSEWMKPGDTQSHVEGGPWPLNPRSDYWLLAIDYL